MASLYDSSTTGVQSNNTFSINDALQESIRADDTTSLMESLEKGAVIDASLELSN